MRKLSCFSSNLNILWTTAKFYQLQEDARNRINLFPEKNYASCGPGPGEGHCVDLGLHLGPQVDQSPPRRVDWAAVRDFPPPPSLPERSGSDPQPEYSDFWHNLKQTRTLLKIPLYFFSINVPVENR